MTFVLRMAVRETRASWKRLVFFFVCVAVGVAAIVALRSVIQSVRDVFGKEARTLIAADVVISTSRDWSDRARSAIDRHLGDAGVTGRTETIETPTMVRPADGRMVARMAEMRAVQPGFPLYGTVLLANGLTYSHALLEHQGVLVRPELLTSLNLNVGDALAIGQATFTIRGVIAKEPGRGGGFSLGPRILIDYADVAATGLLGFGSRAGRQILAAVPDSNIDALVRSLRRDLRGEFINARSYRTNDDEVGRRLRSRGELPEPRRPDHRDPRRNRGVQRHARVHHPENTEHRRPEVRRRPKRTNHRRLRPSGGGARPRGQPPRRRDRARGCRRNSIRARAEFDVAPGRGILRRQLARRRARHRYRRARLAALLGRAAAARPLRQAVAAVTRRGGAAGGHRLDSGGGGCVRFARSRGAHRLAGLVASRRRRRLRRVRGPRGRAAAGRTRAGGGGRAARLIAFVPVAPRRVASVAPG